MLRRSTWGLSSGLLTLLACGGPSNQGQGSFDAGGLDATVGAHVDARTGAQGDARLSQGDAGGGGTLGCSANLRSVVSATGAVVMTCRGDEGCSDGACISACAAAAASHGSLGCDFWVSTPVTYDVEAGQQQPCFGMFVANTWGVAATLTVSRAGTTYDTTLFGAIPSQTAPPAAWPALTAAGVPVDGVAVLYLSGAPGVGFVEDPTDILSCPQMTATGSATEPTWTAADGGATGTSHAFHVTSSVPVSAYDIFPFGGANSHFPAAELLYPSSAWGTSYVVIATPDGTASPQRLKFVDIVAYQDGTSVTFSPSVGLPGGGGYPGVAAGTSTTFTLNAGEYAHWETQPTSTELSGSLVLATNPVSVTAGEDSSVCSRSRSRGARPRTRRSQGPPRSATTTRSRRTRRDAPTSRRSPSTTASSAPSPARPSRSTPRSRRAHVDGASQVSDFQAVGAFRVSSQDSAHPFAIAQVMSTGNVNFDGRTFRTDCATIEYLGQPKACGDEDFVPLVPPAQFLSSYVFFTDPTYSTTTIDLVRAKASGVFHDVTVDCLGTIQGWQAVDSANDYEFARADLLRGVVPGTRPDGGACANGRHVATSDGPLASSCTASIRTRPTATRPAGTPRR